jgi:hypothetical protein
MKKKIEIAEDESNRLKIFEQQTSVLSHRKFGSPDQSEENSGMHSRMNSNSRPAASGRSLSPA